MPEWTRCETLRRLFVGGEPLARELVQRAAATRPGLELVNLYGPAEATIDATASIINADDDIVVIGKPIEDRKSTRLNSSH